jgi:hypothetical protein
LAVPPRACRAPQIVELDADCVSLHFGRRAAFARVLTDHRKWTVRGAAPGIAKLKYGCGCTSEAAGQRLWFRGGGPMQ